MPTVSSCPDYNPQLAQKLTGRRTARGWAGNPFFHPFLWKDIFLFELEYHNLGRIRQAIPVTQTPRARPPASARP